MMDPIDLIYHCDAEPLLAEGATQGWLYVWDGKPGPARAMQVVAFTDAEGAGFVEPVGEWQDVTVVDDSQPTA